MSRRKVKKVRAATGGATCASHVNSPAIAMPEEAILPKHVLREVKDRGSAYIQADQWDALLELSQLSLADFAPAEQDDARFWLTRIRAWAIAHGGNKSFHQLNQTERTELLDVLTRFALLTQNFYRYPEFGLFLSHHGYSLEHIAAAYTHLAKACSNVVDMDWLSQLRNKAIRILRRDLFDDEQSTDAERALLEQIPDVITTLDAAYALAQRCETLTAEERLLVTVFQADLYAISADGNDYADVAAAIKKLPSPAPAKLALTPPPSGPASSSEGLTPQGWAFMYELAHAPLSEYSRLLKDYPTDFGCAAVDGLRQLVSSVLAPSEEVDGKLQRAADLLAQFFERGAEFFGSYLSLEGPEGPVYVEVGSYSLNMPLSVEKLVLHIAEFAPATYPRSNLLMSMYRVFDAYSAYGEVDVIDLHQDISVLWEKDSLTFQFILAGVYEDPVLSALALGRALSNCIAFERNPPKHYFVRNIAADEYSEEDALALLDMLEQLVALRERMTSGVAEVWKKLVSEVIAPLSMADASVRPRTLALARKVKQDLLDKGLAFRLGYLEQVAGDAHEALAYYLTEIDAQGKEAEIAASNALLLWRKSSDPALVNTLLARLQSTYVIASNAPAMAPLLKDLKARQEALNEQLQFAQTARNRWPTVTAPARKLLGVLATITQFKSFKELGDYAGLDETWTRKHYNKLVELGMVFDSGSKFEVNPVIRPLIEQESQHAVVGRIVRGDGTSAVKQVFNSQREFSIYQVMIQLCANHLVFPNCSLQSVMNYDRMKTLVDSDDFGYYLRASVDIVVVSSTTFLPMLAIEVDSIWHDTERQQLNDDKKDRLFAAAGIPFMRLRPVGSPSENTIRGQVAEHLDELVRTLRTDLPGYEQARGLLEDLSLVNLTPAGDMHNLAGTATLPSIGEVGASPSSSVALD